MVIEKKSNIWIFITLNTLPVYKNYPRGVFGYKDFFPPKNINKVFEYMLKWKEQL